MGEITDTARTIDRHIRKMRSLLDQHNVSIKFNIVEGKSLHDIRFVREHRTYGGWYVPTTNETWPAERPATTIDILESQAPIIDCNDTITLITGGHRSSKTTVGAFCALRAAVEKSGARVAYLLPSWAKYDTVHMNIVGFGKPLIADENKQDHKWTLYNGSEIKCFSFTSSSKEQKSFLGYEFDLIIIEEFREVVNPEENFRAAYSRIISLGGRMLVSSSPEVGHPLERMVLDREINSIPVKVFSLSALNNPFAKPNKENPNKYFNIAKQLYPSDRYQRDVLGEYVQDKSVDYSDFNRDTMVGRKPQGWIDITQSINKTQHYINRLKVILKNPTIKTTPQIKRIVGLDIGLENHACFVSLNRNSDKLSSVNICYYVMDELEGRDNEGLRQFIPKLKNHPLLRGIPPKQILICCDPYSARIRATTDGLSPYKLLEVAGFSTLFDKHSRQNARDAMNAKFKQGNIVISPKCSKLIKSLLIFKSGDRPQSRISKDPMGHMPDSLKYVVSVLSPWTDIESYVMSQS